MSAILQLFGGGTGSLMSRSEKLVSANEQASAPFLVSCGRKAERNSRETYAEFELVVSGASAPLTAQRSEQSIPVARE